MLDHKSFLIGLEDLKALRIKKAQIKKQETDNNEEIDKLVYDLVEYMDATDQLSVRVKGIGMASRTSRMFYNVDKDDVMAAHAFESWMRAQGDWELVLAVHHSKLHGYYKERLDLNEELPPGVKTSIKNNISIRG